MKKLNQVNRATPEINSYAITKLENSARKAFMKNPEEVLFNKKIVIAIASQDDITELANLEQDCFPSDHISMQQFRHLLKSLSAEVTTVRQNNHLIGSSVVLFRKNSKRARLYSLAVHPKVQQQGIAKELCRLIEQECTERRCVEIHLEVRKDNTKALNFYYKIGYQLLGEYKNFYTDGEDAIRLCKPIPHGIEIA